MENTISNPIVVIEDNAMSAGLLTANIKKYWVVDVHMASTFAEAKTLLKRHRFEYLVAICDLNLPDAPDGEILDLVDKAGVRFIALTGHLTARQGKACPKSTSSTVS